jgi:hypothetical protein
MNARGWWRLYVVTCAALGVVTLVGLGWFLLVIDFHSDSAHVMDGDLARSLALIGVVAWVVPCLALLGLGYGVAWVRRGFGGQS